MAKPTPQLPAMLMEDDKEGCGPEMLALSPMQRKFVQAYLLTGGRNMAECARMAGYSAASPNALNVTAHRVSHDEKVLAAIKAEANKRLLAGAVLGASVIMDIALDPLHKDRFKAAVRLVEHAGMIIGTEHKVTVEHTGKTTAEQIERIRRLAEQLDLDPKTLLGSAAEHIVDAEFTEVADDEWTIQPEKR